MRRLYHWLAALITLSCSPLCLAWGGDGHRITAEIASRRLSPQAAAAVGQLLAPQNLPDVSTWADEVRRRSEYSWSAPLHYVNLMPGTDHYDGQRDCPEGKCVVGAIQDEMRTLRDPSTPREKKAEALRFLVHFVGDVHQPLHVSHAHDKGGNDIAVEFFHNRANLHQVWDSLILRRTQKSWQEYAQQLSDRINPDQQAEWARDIDPARWATESYRLAVSHAYAIPKDGRLDQAYYERNLPVVEQRLSMAGVRLAAVLNSVLTGPEYSATAEASPVGPADAPAAVVRPALNPSDVQTIRSLTDAQYDSLFDLYRHLHQHPELSLKEEQTGQRMARLLAEGGYEVTGRVGGHGVVAVLRNGSGPTVMYRCDLDALPVKENTRLPFASTVTATDDDGNEVPVMHACGHDVHMTCLIGVSRVLAAMKDRWSGTLMLVAQPAEERGGGAQNMLKDGLFTRFPKPDYALALHVDSIREAGKIVHVSGFAMANVDSLDITIRGRGGHGASPHTTVDPILLASRTIVALQGIVAREIKPTEPAVVTVGSIHGGTKHNIIPDEVRLQLTVRSYKDEIRQQLKKAIERIVRGEAVSAGAPEPIIDYTEGTPSTYNDPALVARCVPIFQTMVGKDRVEAGEPVMGGEDFSFYGRAGVCAFMFSVGSVDPAKIARSREPGGPPLPSLHSALYAPVPEPTIKAGVNAASAALLHLLQTH